MTDHQDSSITGNGDRKIRYAVVGLGWISQAAVLPAFVQAENSELVALVGDNSTKLQELSKQYDIKHTYYYREYEDCLKSGLIDAVYIALPNSMHCDYTVRAANAGIQVLCEKPMAVSQHECEQMIKACQDNGVKLMIAYRLHFEAANMEAVKIVQSGQIGEPRIFNSVFSQQVKPGDIRLRQALGGGTLDDLGIYCINAARYLFQDEPIEVFATSVNSGEERFNEVDTTTTAILRFPDERLATFTCSFGGASVSTYQVIGTQGDLRLDPAYAFQVELKHKLTIDGVSQEHTFDQQNQFAAELIYFSNCILQNQEPRPLGLEGSNDVRIIEALYKAIATRQPVEIHLEVPPRPSVDQVINCPPLEEPKLVQASDPSGRF